MQAEPAVTDETVRRKWGGGDVVMGMLLALAFTLLFQSFYAILLDPEPGDRSLGFTFVNFAGLWVGWLAIVFYASKVKGSGSLRRDFGVGIVWRKDIPMGVALGLAGQAMVFVLYLPLSIFAPDVADRVSEPAENLTAIAHGWGLIPLGISICLAAPLVEEIFFRGLAMRAFIFRWGQWIGIGAASTLFAVVHYNPEELPLQLPALFAFAFMLGVIAQRNGRLGANIVGHAVFNTVSFTLLVT